MDMYDGRLARFAVAGALALATFPGCNERAPTSPTPPSTPPPAVFITGIQPNVSGTNGATIVTITGAGFEPGALVTLGTAATGVTVVNSTTITAAVPVHPPGAVDVIVTNIRGGSGSIRAGFTYLPPLAVTAISPRLGSTDGGTVVTIAGVGIHSGTRMSLGGSPMQIVVYQGSIFFATPPHGAGPVDIVVDNGVTAPHVLAGGFTYAAPGSFDFNGVWEGEAGTEGEFPFQITIQDDFVTRLRCGKSDPLTLTTEIPVRDGSFAFSREDAGATSGRIVAPDAARGSIDTAQCRATSWYARKQ